MPGLPSVLVYLDDVNNSGTFPHNVSDYVRLADPISMSTRGRADEASSPSPATLNLTFENIDGRFSLGSTVGGYGAINLDRAIRVQLAFGGPYGSGAFGVGSYGGPVTIFTGFVQSWPVSWPDGSQLYAVAQVTAVDAMARWSRRTLRSIPEEEILRDNPDFYYTMGEPEGALVASDSSGKSAPALGQWSTGTNVTFGTATGPGTDGLTAATFAAVPEKWLRADGNFTPLWATVAFNTTTISGGGALLLSVNPNLRTPDDWWAIGLDMTGHLYATNSFQTVTSTRVVTDGATHVASALLTPGTPGSIDLYLDGLKLISAPGTVLAPAGGGQMEVGNNFIGTIAHVAGGADVSTFSGGAAASRFAAHAQALQTGFDGEASSARVSRLAAYEGSAPWYGGVATSTKVPFVELSGKSVAEAIEQVADAEQSAAYVDAFGRTVLHPRSQASLNTTPILFLPVDSDIVFPDTSIEVDMQRVVNYASGSRAVSDSSTQVVRNAASEAAHGRYPESKEYLVATDDEVFQRLAWLVAAHAEPSPRVGQIQLDLLSADLAVQRAVAALDIDDHLQITGMPAQTPGGSSLDVAVEGYAMTISASEWTWTGNVVSWDAYKRAGVLDSPTYGVLDSTLRLAV